MAELLCVQCRRHPADSLWRPFCSERCRLLDLGRWLDGGYRLPGEPIDAASLDDAHGKNDKNDKNDKDDKDDEDDAGGSPEALNDPWPEPDDR